jgi:hypothetical protein
MKRLFLLVVTFGFIGSLGTSRAFSAPTLIVGVNATGAEQLKPQEQDAYIAELVKAGVKVVRTGFGNSCVAFIIRANRSGIRVVATISPNQIGSDAHTRPAYPSFGLWAERPISDADPAGFKSWAAGQLATLEAAGVRLVAFELGNEINGPYFNADFLPSQASGRVLGIKELTDPNDAEGKRISASYKTYLQVMAALKDVRDRSKLNRSTPIISAGLADGGLPGKKPGQKLDGVSIPATIEFLRDNGMDKLVDGYGVHIYPDGLAQGPAAALTNNLTSDALAECRKDKPCWVTEWGFAVSDQSCPVKDAAIVKAVDTTREALKHFADQGRLAALIAYTWTDKNDGIFRCGKVTDAGKEELSPLP